MNKTSAQRLGSTRGERGIGKRVAAKEEETKEANCLEAEEVKRSEAEEAKRSETQETKCSEAKESEQEVKARKNDFEVNERSRNELVLYCIVIMCEKIQPKRFQIKETCIQKHENSR